MTASRRRVVAFGLTGNIVEWYEFGVYGYLAHALGEVFFPASERSVQMISTFALFAGGFVMRPLGALVFGRLGDLIGRMRALGASVLLMALSTFAIGLLPPFERIGTAAPILLSFLRLLQGLSVGGEYGGSITYLYEHAPEGKKSLFASFAVLSTIGGIFLGSLSGTIVFATLAYEDVIAWGWRIPFVLGGLGGMVVYFWRRAGAEPAEYLLLRTSGGTALQPVRELWRDHRGLIVTIASVLSLQAVGFYTVFVLMPTLLGSEQGVLFSTPFVANVLSMALLCLLLAPMAQLSERLGRRHLHFVGSLGYAVLALPLVWFAADGDFVRVLTAQILFAICHATIAAPTPAMLAAAFPTRIRYTGVAISYNLGIAVFGGSAPLIVVTLNSLWSSSLWAGLIMVVAAGITLAALTRLPDPL